MPRRSARVLVVVLLTCLFASVYGAARAGEAGGDPGVDLPDVGLEGVNDERCHSGTRPRPVVLVHGTFGTAATHFDVLAPALRQDGWCVYALDYGNHATARVAASAKELTAFVGDVLAATGASMVDLVGYSQGGMMPRWYLRFEGGADEVNALVGIAPSNHGTGGGILTAGTLATPGGSDPGILDCLACLDQLAGSPFMRTLNAGGDILPIEGGAEGAGSHIHYTTIATRLDIVVVPYTSQALAGPADRVTNLVLQDLCPANRATHISIRDDPLTIQLVRNALHHDGLANPPFQPACTAT